MPSRRRASSKTTSFHPYRCQQPRDTKIKRAKPTSTRTRKASQVFSNETARCTRSQTALRSKENMQLQVIRNQAGDKKDLDCMYTRTSAGADQGTFSGICITKECRTRKGVKRKKASCKALNESKKRKCCPKNTAAKAKRGVDEDAEKEVNSVQEMLQSKTSHSRKKRKTTLNAPANQKEETSGDDKQVAPDEHQAIKTRIGLIRQRILDEQLRAQRLQNKLARNKDTARASLSCRRIRIHKELSKLKEKLQSEDKKRLKAEDHRIQRLLEVGQRKVDSERLSMKTKLANEWRDRFQRRKGDVQRAKRALKGQIRSHEVEKRELLKQLRKDWTTELNSLEAMKDRIEMEKFRDGLQWDGFNWTSTAGKHKYSLRRAPREKTHVYCRAWKMKNRKELQVQECADSPPSGATVYKETKRKALMELYQLLDSELRCSICSELFISPVVLNCSHTFCSFCIKQWKRRTDCCPICRSVITSRNPVPKLDAFITKSGRWVGRDVEQKRSETIKDRQDQEKELRQGGRTWGNLSSHSLDDLDLDDDDDFNDSLDSDDSDVDEFLEMLTFHRFFGFGRILGDDSDSDDEDMLSSSFDGEEDENEDLDDFDNLEDYFDDSDDEGDMEDDGRDDATENGEDGRT